MVALVNASLALLGLMSRRAGFACPSSRAIHVLVIGRYGYKAFRQLLLPIVGCLFHGLFGDHISNSAYHMS
jgi:hypothetical protein